MIIKKLLYLMSAVLIFTLYLIYSYNEHSGRSYIYEPVYISLRGEIPNKTSLSLIYQTINDPVSIQHATLLSDDSIPENTVIFRIDSAYRLSNFSIYFRSLPDTEIITITEITASNINSGAYSFSLKSKDLKAAGNLKLDQIDDNTITIRRIPSQNQSSSALSFNMRSSFYGVFVRTNIRVPEIPSLLSFIFIGLLSVLLAYSLFPLISNLKVEAISVGAYLLALAFLILPTGQKICNLLLAVSILAGIISHLKVATFRIWFVENRLILFVTGTILLIYIIAFLCSLSDSASRSLLAIKFGLPMALMAVAINTNNKNETHLQYAALLTGVLISVFVHFGWAIMLVDSIELKTKLFSHPRYFIESSVFSRVHHSYLSVIYLTGLTIIYFHKNLLPLRKKERIIFASLILSALLFAFSRASVLSLALVLIFIAAKGLFRLLKLEITYVVRFITAFALTIALLGIIFLDFGGGSSIQRSSIKGLQTRMTLWDSSADIIKQKPLLGWGPGNYKQVQIQGSSQDSTNSNTWKNLNTHNQFLETSGMFGLVVGISLIWFLLFPKGFPRQNSSNSEFIFIIAILFITSFLFESFLNRNLGILIFGLVYGLVIKHIPESPENQQTI